MDQGGATKKMSSLIGNDLGKQPYPTKLLYHVSSDFAKSLGFAANLGPGLTVMEYFKFQDKFFEASSSGSQVPQGTIKLGTLPGNINYIAPSSFQALTKSLGYTQTPEVIPPITNTQPIYIQTPGPTLSRTSSIKDSNLNKLLPLIVMGIGGLYLLSK